IGHRERLVEGGEDGLPNFRVRRKRELVSSRESVLNFPLHLERRVLGLQMQRERVDALVIPKLRIELLWERDHRVVGRVVVKSSGDIEAFRTLWRRQFDGVAGAVTNQVFEPLRNKNPGGFEVRAPC